MIAERNQISNRSQQTVFQHGFLHVPRGWGEKAGRRTTLVTQKKRYSKECRKRDAWYDRFQRGGVEGLTAACFPLVHATSTSHEYCSVTN